MRVGNQVATAILDESLLAGAASPSDIRRAADAAALAAVVKVSRFEVDPPVRLDAGEQLFFSLSGNPGGKASVRIKGVKGKLSLSEVTVRLQGGGTQMISYAAEPPFRVGDKVKVENGALVANS